MFVLDTSRLVLRDFVESDWSVIHALSCEVVVTQYQTWLRLSTPVEAQHWVENTMYHNRCQPRHAYNVAIVHQHDVIGWIGWGRSSNQSVGDYDVGYALLPTAWGHGFMTEALCAAFEYMFQSLGAHLIFGECASRNIASARVMEKVGMTLSATWLEQNEVTGEEEEHQRYIMSSTAWHTLDQTRRTG